MRVTGKTGRTFEMVGYEPVFNEWQMRWSQVAVWEGKCATCGAPFHVRTPSNCVDGKYSKDFELANCEAHRVRQAA